ncbi:hypothetical protein [Rathayibacter festucae]|uniref:hypothetical protein n=1 Tax=Rathayibacter festucae TaxID=110937 RepID=UPI002A6A7DBF|nr:hypothetical protein [Rathayibacter festucae]MDY0912263.1 hypothetical protein [Rathayibacter festucae]
MAGAALTVDTADDDLLPAWRTVVEVARTGIAENLTLVGGLMVAVHARRADVVMRRPTDDMDALVDYWTHRSGLIEASSALRGIGFELADGDHYAYRFVHADGRSVDLMVADHLPSRMRPRLALRPAFAAPAGQQAIDRRDICTLTFTSGARVELGVPDELGALVAKGAAYLVDNRDRGRYLDDAAVLLACVSDASELDYEGMSQNDRRRLRAVLGLVGSDAHSSWVALDDSARARGLMNAHLISGALL